MAKVRLAAFAVFLSAFLFFCDALIEKRVKAIENRLIEYDHNFNAGRFDDILDMWADDGILIPIEGEVRIGKAEIKKHYDLWFVGKGFKLVSETKKVFGRGNALSAYGTCEVRNPDGTLFVFFRFIINFQRIDKEWMIIGDVDNRGEL